MNKTAFTHGYLDKEALNIGKTLRLMGRHKGKLALGAAGTTGAALAWPDKKPSAVNVSKEDLYPTHMKDTRSAKERIQEATPAKALKDPYKGRSVVSDPYTGPEADFKDNARYGELSKLVMDRMSQRYKALKGNFPQMGDPRLSVEHAAGSNIDYDPETFMKDYKGKPFDSYKFKWNLPKRTPQEVLQDVSGDINNTSLDVRDRRLQKMIQDLYKSGRLSEDKALELIGKMMEGK